LQKSKKLVDSLKLSWHLSCSKRSIRVCPRRENSSRRSSSRTSPSSTSETSFFIKKCSHWASSFSICNKTLSSFSRIENNSSIGSQLPHYVPCYPLRIDRVNTLLYRVFELFYEFLTDLWTFLRFFQKLGDVQLLPNLQGLAFDTGLSLGLLRRGWLLDLERSSDTVDLLHGFPPHFV